MESSLKGNAENSYCRSWQFELMKSLYAREFELISSNIEENLRTGVRKQFSFKEGLAEQIRKIADDFHFSPLKNHAPDIEKGQKELQNTLAGLAALAAQVR